MRVAGTARLGGGKLGGYGLANNDRAGLAQCRDAGPVALGAPSREQRRAVLGRHVSGLDDVLDAQRHAVDRRALPPFAPTLSRLIGSSSRALEIEVYEGADLRLERSKISETALEEIPRRARAVGKARRPTQVSFVSSLIFSSGASMVTLSAANGEFLPLGQLHGPAPRKRMVRFHN